MNVYELSFNHIRTFIVAESEEDARKIGEDPAQYPDLHFRPFEVVKVEVEGYAIEIKPCEDISTLTRDGLKAWLKEREIPFFNGASEEKLRELALSHV
jgi:hypothetical protein